jgi:hypothetical protein
MEIQEIDVYLDKTGQVRLEVRGVKGRTCLEITTELEQALGGEVTAREFTPDAYEGQPVTESDAIRLRK